VYRRFKGRDQNAKIGNTPTTCQAGFSHRSKLESSVCQIIHLRIKAGEIVCVQHEDHVYLTRARIGYVPDFKCTSPDGSFFWVEAKGFPNDVWPLKKKLWKFYGPGLLEIWTGSWANPKLTEIITPKGGGDSGTEETEED
jgi:hypothetical protein